MQSNKSTFQSPHQILPQIQNINNISLPYHILWPYQLYQPQIIPTYNYQSSQFYSPYQNIPLPYAFYPGFPTNQMNLPQNCQNTTQLKQEYDEQQLEQNQQNLVSQVSSLQESESSIQKKKPLIKQTKNRIGHWKNEEHYLYLKFVRKNSELFKTSARKKLNRVFKLMSLEIPTRTPCQCRSHFSKFNPFDDKQKTRRKLVNDERAYERMFCDQLDQNEEMNE